MCHRTGYAKGLVFALRMAARLATAAAACTPISGYDQSLAHAHGIIVGDLHGTVEVPAFVANARLPFVGFRTGNRPLQDRRSSHAVLELLSWVRQQIRSGARVRVVAFDAFTHPLSGQSVVDTRARVAPVANGTTKHNRA